MIRMRSFVFAQRALCVLFIGTVQKFMFCVHNTAICMKATLRIGTCIHIFKTIHMYKITQKLNISLCATALLNQPNKN